MIIWKFFKATEVLLNLRSILSPGGSIPTQHNFLQQVGQLGQMVRETKFFLG